jgi:isoleucyl-tRNA synthetase
VVSLDLTVTDALREEGLARDVVRVVQQARRDAGLRVSDRIDLTVSGPDAVLDAVRRHQAFLAGEVLATTVELESGPPPAGGATAEVGDGLTVTVAVARA